MTQRDLGDHSPGSLGELEEEGGHRRGSKGSGLEDGSLDEKHHSLLCEANGAHKQEEEE